MRTHVKPVRCPKFTDPTVYCPVRKAEQRDMSRHMETAHGWPKQWEICEFCGKVITRADRMKRHKREIHGIA